MVERRAGRRAARGAVGGVVLAAWLAGCSSPPPPPPSSAGASARGGLRARLKEDLRALAAACHTVDLAALAQKDTFPQACKAALAKVLIPIAGNHLRRLVALGHERRDGRARLFVTATDSRGRVRAAWERGDVAVFVVQGEARLAVDPGRVVIRDQAAVDAVTTSISSVLDYSGSMSDKDVDDSIAIFLGLYRTIRPRGLFESDVILFSTTVRRKGPFTSDLDRIEGALARDPLMPRATTALLDAMGEGLAGLAARPTPVRILAVATDGRENASTHSSKDEVVALAQENNIPVVFFGTLFSDIALMRDVTEKTGGVFVYGPTALLLKPQADKVQAMLQGAKAIEVEDPRLDGADAVVVAFEGQEVRFPLRRR